MRFPSSSTVAIAVVAVLLLCGGFLGHSYVDPYEPKYRYGHAITHESTAAFDRYVEDATTEFDDELSPHARAFVRNALAAGDPPDSWGEGEDGFRRWRPDVCRDFTLVCVNGYSAVPDEFEYGHAGGTYVVEYGGERYLLLTGQRMAVDDLDFSFLFVGVGMGFPGVVLAYVLALSSLLSRRAIRVFVAAGIGSLAWGLSSPYLVMLGLGLSTVRMVGAAGAMVVAVGAAAITLTVQRPQTD